MERRSGLYVIGHLQRGHLVPMYVGRSDENRRDFDGGRGVRGRLLYHLTRNDWDGSRPRLTHFAFDYVDDPTRNFALESWHFHHYPSPLNGGSGGAAWNGHPARPVNTYVTCPEPGCYYHHAKVAGLMRAHELSHMGRSREGFLVQDWPSILKRYTHGQWGYEEDPKQIFSGRLLSPLKRPIKLSPLNFNYVWRGYRDGWNQLRPLHGVQE